ncbi:extracellular solute-binding protein [Arthrobacter sp. NicSoilB8]|uniref:ABC transporter substrate-binding protein n=1 Tax=Arthrobacter sp. NicSoilB8 TaxID=2830998 RepID=UPI001CC36C28|nr:extracellular solute-binding protein [Arthrobacter sp. NicSoilB8]
MALTGCGGPGASSTGSTGATVVAGSGEGTINVWAVDGQAAENDALKKIISNFESSQSKIKVNLKLFPSDQYTKAVNSAAPGDLPDVLDFDGPTLASFVYNGKMAPLKGSVSDATLSNQTDSIKSQNTVDDAVYGVGMMNAGLALWGNKKLLDAAGVAYPTTPEKAWPLTSSREFWTSSSRWFRAASRWIFRSSTALPANGEPAVRRARSSGPAAAPCSRTTKHPERWTQMPT